MKTPVAEFYFCKSAEWSVILLNKGSTEDAFL